MGQSDFLRYSLAPLLLSAGLWAISVAHPSEISDFLCRHLPTVLTTHVPLQLINYPILAVFIYGLALAISGISSRLNPYPYVRIREQTKEGNRLSFSFTLSGVAKNGARVDVAPEDHQAVAGKHYRQMDPVRIAFPAGLTDSTDRLVVTLTGERIGGRHVGSDDFFVKFSNPQRLRLGRLTGWERVKDIIAFCLSGAFFGLFIGIGDILFRWLLKGPFPGDLLAPIFVDIGGGKVAGQLAPVQDLAFAWHHLVWSALAVPWLLLSHALATVIFVAVTSWLPRSDEEREWLGRAAGWYLVMALAWAAVSALVLLLPLAAKQLLGGATDDMGWKEILATSVSVLGPASGILTAVVGGSSKTPAVSGLEQSGWRKLALYVGAPVFLMSLFLGLALLIDWLAFRRSFPSEIAAASGDKLWWIVEGLVLYGIVPAFLSAMIGYFININRFSLHEMYRNRLVRAFLGASNTRSTQRDSFSFFNFTDNLPMSRLWMRREEKPARPQEDNPPAKDLGPKPPRPHDWKDWRPFHIINIALNIVSTDKLAWQERKAESFTVSPLWCGSAQLDAYRRTSEYGGKEPISLGTAMAISGAAVSPNMGYNSSPLITFLLTLFNVRLGWWLGNPKRARFEDEGPRWAAAPLLYELFGLTNDTRKYVYLSDGGHFENLGLYEMVRRRCHLIIVSDAGQDKDLAFGDLSNAVRKIRIDLGISIEFEDLKCLRLRNTKRRDPDRGGPCYTIGRIRYSEADKPVAKLHEDVHDGIIIYLKPGFRGDETADIVGYAASSTDFPHETTVDQWFSESQFESYRNLGYAIMGRAHRDEKLGEDEKHWRDYSADGKKAFRQLDINGYLKSKLEGKTDVKAAETDPIL
jgi:hypothetical protein